MKDQQRHILNERIPATPPAVPPVDAVMRPLWSIMIPVYNCSEYIPETLISVLAQCKHRTDIQIEVVDDASTDADVEDLVQRVGEGRVAYFRQPENVGSLRNFHSCLVRARGVYVHILHGDDKVRPGFYERFESFFSRHPAAAAAFCRYAYIDSKGAHLYNHEQQTQHEGILHNFVAALGERQRIQYAAMVVKRKTYETLGGFCGVEYGEDWEMWMRIASRLPIGYIPEIFADYRKHQNSISGRSVLTGKNIRDLRKVMSSIEPLLPADEKQNIVSSSRKFYAYYAIRTANQIWFGLRNRAGAVAQIREGWSLHKDFLLAFKIVKLYTRMTIKI